MNHANVAGKIYRCKEEHTNVLNLGEAVKGDEDKKISLKGRGAYRLCSSLQNRLNVWVCFFYNGHISVGLHIRALGVANRSIYNRSSWHLLFTARSVTRQQGAFDYINPTQMCSIAGYNFSETSRALVSPWGGIASL